MSRPKRPAPVAVPNPLQGLWRRVSTWRGRGHASPSVRLDAFDRTLVARFPGAYEGHARAALEVPADLVQPNAFADVAAHWKPGTTKNNSALQTTARSWDCAGASTSLYDRTSGEARNGDPNADRFLAVTGANFAWLAVADGVNWGVRPMTAAVAAVEGASEYMRRQLTQLAGKPLLAARDLAIVLFDAVMAAQAAIIEADGTLTTFCCALAFPLARLQPQTPTGDQAPSPWVVLVAAVGDSRAYILPTEGDGRPPKHVTEDGVARLDVRDPGGVLGFADDQQPDLANFRLAYEPLQPGDLMVLCTDGVHDNLDPQIRNVPPSALDMPYKTWDELEAIGLDRLAEETIKSISEKKADYVLARWQEFADAARGPALRNEPLVWPPATVAAPAAAAAGGASESYALHFAETVVTAMMSLTEALRSRIESAELNTPAPTPGENETWDSVKYSTVKREHAATLRGRAAKLEQDLKTLPGKTDHATVVCARVPLVAT